jgi:RNA polymerase sigma-70 factor, ECF subfamily
VLSSSAVENNLLLLESRGLLRVPFTQRPACFFQSYAELLIQCAQRKVIRLAPYSSMSDQALIRACAEDDDSAAWEEFVSRFKKAISLSIIRTAREWGQIATEILDDLIQETFLKLYANQCRSLLHFTIQHPEAPVVGYIKTIAINLTRDHFRALFTEKRGGGQMQQLPADSDYETNILPDHSHKVMEQQVLLSQIEQFVFQCSSGADRDRDLLIFTLHYRQGMSASAIAALPGIGLTTKGVESAIFRLTKQVRARIADTRLKTTTDLARDEKGFQSPESV